MQGLGGIQAGSLRPSQVLGASGEITVTDNGNGTITLSIAAGLNPFVVKGDINCSANPNYPAANAGHVYFVSAAGKIGGASGPVVAVADSIICVVDGSVSGDHATVGANWRILDTNLDLTNISITGGSISGCNITVGAGKTLDVSAGTLTLADNQISGDKVEGGTINAVTINTLTGTQATIPTIYGSSAANGDITIYGTSSATKASSYTLIEPTGAGRVVIGATSDPLDGTLDGKLTISSSGAINSHLDLVEIRTQAAGRGAGFNLCGTNNDAGTAFQRFATIVGAKLNGTTGNTIGYFAVSVANSSSGIGEGLRVEGDSLNLGIGGQSAFGTGAEKTIAIKSGVIPSDIVADAVQMTVADFLGTGGDARLHIMGEASAAYKTAIGSGKVTILGTTGGFTRAVSEAAANIEADASTTIEVNIPATSRIIGVQLRVDTALTATELWDASFSGGSTDAICTGQAVAQNTKVNALPSIVVTSETDIVITKNGGGSFTAAGNIRAWVYYEYLETLADAA